MFPARFLDAPLRDADESLHLQLESDIARTLRSRANRLNFTESIEAWVATSLCRSASTEVDVVANDFGMSTRTFQRKLAVYEIGYLDIRNCVRSHIAKCMLTETKIQVTSLALQLGYSETSAFSRSFKSWVGQTPGEFRRREGVEALLTPTRSG
jgi:AraC-like DNA-binding protein